jgi:hypothetical protein
MVSLAALWLPIVLAAVAVFFVSSIFHIVLPFHRNDYSKMPGEEGVLAAMRDAGVKRGMYMFPHLGSMAEMNTPEGQEKYRTGPVGILVVMPSGPVNMGKHLALWFGYCLLVSFFVAYLAAHTMAAGTHYLGVFRIVGTAAFLAYGFGYLTHPIWKGETWGVSLKGVFDGLVYGLVTAGVFGWLWPAA